MKSANGYGEPYPVTRRGRLEYRASRVVYGKRVTAVSEPGLRTKAAMIASALQRLELKLEQCAPNAERITLAQYLFRYSAEKEAAGEIREQSRVRYDCHTRRHVAGDAERPHALGAMQLVKVTDAHVAAHFVALETAGASAGTRKAVFKLLHAAFARAAARKMITRSPLEHVTTPKHRPKHRRPLATDTVDRIFAAIEGHPLEALFWIAAMRSYRMSEILGLRWLKFDYTDETLTVDEQLLYPPGRGRGWRLEPLKGGDESTRVHAQHPAVVALLRRAKIGHGPEEFIFQDSIGGPLRPCNFRMRVWYPLLDAARLPRTPFHRFRNTGIAIFARANANDVAATRALSGHATDAQVLDYIGETHRVPRAQTTAADRLWDRLLAQARADRAGR